MASIINDNLLASIVDKKVSPLEEASIGNDLEQLEISETLEMVTEIKILKPLIDKIAPTKIPACEEFIDQLKLFRELRIKNSSSDSNKIL